MSWREFAVGLVSGLLEFCIILAVVLVAVWIGGAF